MPFMYTYLYLITLLNCATQIHDLLFILETLIKYELKILSE